MRTTFAVFSEASEAAAMKPIAQAIQNACLLNRRMTSLILYGYLSLKVSNICEIALFGGG
jgi:hypothetical protein